MLNEFVLCLLRLPLNTHSYFIENATFRLELATEVFSWLSFAVMFGWFWALITGGIMAQSNGHRKVWHQSINEGSIFTGKSEDADQATAYKMGHTSSFPASSSKSPSQNPLV